VVTNDERNQPTVAELLARIEQLEGRIRRKRGLRRLVPGRVGMVIAIALAFTFLPVLAPFARAAYPTDTVTVYTGCLNTGGTGGQLLSLAASPTTPAKPCSSMQTLVHLSGGTVTSVSAGTGLSGDGSDGAVTLSLGTGYTLPQSCSAGNVPGWIGSAWTCYQAGTGLSANTGADKLDVAGSYQLPQSCAANQVPQSTSTSTWQCANQTSYSNGTGLDLSGNTFSIDPNYQLPQGCGTGQVSGANGDGTWSCQSEPTGANFALSNQGCTSSQFATGVDGSGKLTCAAPPANSNDVTVARFNRFGGIAIGGSGADVVSLVVPAGNYLIAGKAELSNFDGDTQAADCSLSTVDDSRVFLGPDGGAADDLVVPLLDTASFATDTSITMHCHTFNGLAFRSVLTATRVSAID
jgi:hypothetical protein